MSKIRNHALPVLALSPLPGRLTATAWALPARLSYPEFEKVCRAFGGAARGMTNAFKWHVADLVLYAERAYGAKAYQALEFLGYAPATLSNIARIGSVFPPPRRRGLPLSFEHFAAVAARHPEEQDEWLDKAEKKGWTRAELRKALQGEDGGAGESRSGSGNLDASELWQRLRQTLDLVKKAREKLEQDPQHEWTTDEVKALIVSLEQALFVEG